MTRRERLSGYNNTDIRTYGYTAIQLAVCAQGHSGRQRQCITRTITVNGEKKESLQSRPDLKDVTDEIDPAEVPDDHQKSPLYEPQGPGNSSRQIAMTDDPGIFAPWEEADFQNKEVILTFRFRTWIVCVDDEPMRVIGYIEWGGTIRMSVGTDEASTRVVPAYDPEPRFVAATSENVAEYNECVRAFPAFKAKP